MEIALVQMEEVPEEGCSIDLVGSSEEEDTMIIHILKTQDTEWVVAKAAGKVEAQAEGQEEAPAWAEAKAVEEATKWETVEEEKAGEEEGTGKCLATGVGIFPHTEGFRRFG